MVRRTVLFFVFIAAVAVLVGCSSGSFLAVNSDGGDGSVIALDGSVIVGDGSLIIGPNTPDGASAGSEAAADAVQDETGGADSGSNADVHITVALAGAGSGAVRSVPAGIDCGSACAATFPSGTTVILVATPANGSMFTGWSGTGCPGTGNCLINLSADVAVTATFVPVFPINVTLAGSGSGTVTSQDGHINCPSTCSASYGQGGVITLTASPGLNSTFAGWSGAGCSGIGTCVVPMTGAVNVTATFTGPQYVLTVNKFGSGSGTVTSSPSGIACGSNCWALFGAGSTVTLTASATSGGFTGWSGGGCSGTGTCVVTMTGAVTVYATFGTPGATTWDPTWSVAGGTFSNGYLSIANTTTSTVNFRTTIGKSSGRYYWEITATAGNGATDAGGLGIMASNEPNNTLYIGYTGVSGYGVSFGYGSCCSTKWWYNWSGVTVSAAPPANSAVNTGIVYMFALDLSTGSFWAGQNGTWYNSGNPTTAVNPSVTGITGTVYPSVTLYGSSIDAFTANFGGSAFVYPVPTGFTAGFY
jgi:hypothetical protein